VSCRPESVTAYVDGELEREAREQIDAHLQGCPTCREQAQAERALRAQLRALPAPPLPEHLEHALRRRLRREPRRVLALRTLLPLAAVLLLGLLWLRGSAPFVALQLARDHGHCFGLQRLPAEIFASEIQPVATWFQNRGRNLPPLPSQAAGLELAGGRFCPLIDRRVAHLYYQDGERHLSLFVIPEPLRLEEAYAATALGHAVRLRRWAGHAIAIVADEARDAEAFERTFETAVANARTRR
jgi:anti-sigma factor RsiW